MINIKKTYSEKIQKELNCEREKENGNYRLESVINLLFEDFLGKCYICEQLNTSSNIEHFIAHEGDKEKKFDLKNLYFACSNCNNIKSNKYNNILDCANSKEDVEKLIKYRIEEFPKTKVIIEPSNTIKKLNNKVKATVDLLNCVYNGTTPLKKANAKNITKLLEKELLQLKNLLKNYQDSDDIELKNYYENLIIKQLQRDEPFYVFKRWYLEDENCKKFLDIT
jgi:5-methylcytosine-specific restriction endonuclease McrA